MKNVSKIELRLNKDEYGSLSVIESTIDIPFIIKRIYYIFNVDENVVRGLHSHRNLEQLLVCVKGSVNIKVINPENEKEFIFLNDPTIGLLIGPNIWREMMDFSEDAVLLVLASQLYDPSDYIRNFDEFINERIV